MVLPPVAIIVLTFIASTTADRTHTTAASSTTGSSNTALIVVTTSTVTDFSSSDFSATNSTTPGPVESTTMSMSPCWQAVGGPHGYIQHFNQTNTTSGDPVFWTAQLITLGTLVTSTTISVIASGFVWASLFLIHFKIRRLQSMNQKVVFAEELLKVRKVPQGLLSRLGRLTHFDEKENERENESLLKSISRKKAPKP
ncbi:hypothetical protein AAVH_07596 [Aphelenchoides avenae]|nr:hypothetical protein AAVH_07596 [Aphelenchus avenae]